MARSPNSATVRLHPAFLQTSIGPRRGYGLALLPALLDARHGDAREERLSAMKLGLRAE
jgi:hypothetical protein